MSSSTTDSPTNTKEEVQNDSISDKVHSANSWETADLGDKQRNEKFLRLMGASKKEHHGKIVIGEKSAAHSRDRKAEAHLQEELEEQFSQGMEHRLAGGRKGHLGLGFHPEDKGDVKKDTDQESNTADTETAASKDSQREGDTEQAPSDQSQKDKTDDHSREKDERKRESSDKDGAHEIKKLKFVKSSS
ncbi:small acidic protein [Elysia marginata]|uniref:Small acidic protein n=1 Tax=Elysia marginata TaxID=1093978 RepID=A0AAV4GAC9_9GAST|nr:small acidic protein [Elysia marginata]